jgi:hypothetical protein
MSASNERDWKQLALWLADCHAATAYYMANTKSMSNSERRRHISICDATRQMIEEGGFTRRPSLLTDVVERLRNASTACTNALPETKTT